MSDREQSMEPCDHPLVLGGFICGPCNGITQEEANRISREALDQAIKNMEKQKNG